MGGFYEICLHVTARRLFDFALNFIDAFFAICLNDTAAYIRVCNKHYPQLCATSFCATLSSMQKLFSSF